MLPYIEVSDLPPSASFYAAVTQPLGLRYISATSSCIVYGTTSASDSNTAYPVFEVRSAANRAEPLRHSHIVLSAASPAVVQNFLAAAARALPDPTLIDGAGAPTHRHSATDAACGDNGALIEDLDGNTMEVVYLPPSEYPSRYGGSTVRRTQSTTDEVSRILDWNLDVATSSPSKSIVSGSGPTGGPVARRPGPGDGPHILRRSVTTSVIETTPTPRENSNGLTTSAVVGGVLGAVAVGAAIGGALTYMGMRNERDRAPRQEYDPPAFHRRSTFPDPYPDHRPKYVERTVEKIYYPDQLPPVKGRYYPPPTYVAKYSQPGGRSREVEELDDRSSRHSSRHSTSSRTRPRSEAASTRRPLMIADTEHRSPPGSRYTTAPKLLSDAEHRSHAGSRHSAAQLPDPDYRSHVSSRHTTPRSIRQRIQPSIQPAAEAYMADMNSRPARSDRSESTIRPSRKSVYAEPQPIVYSDIPIRSRAPSKAPTKASKAPSRHSSSHSAATVKMVPSRAQSYTTARMTPLPESRKTSMVSARDIPLPQSHANWDDDNDNDSIAPSDSISCVGSRPSRSARAYR